MARRTPGPGRAGRARPAGLERDLMRRRVLVAGRVGRWRGCLAACGAGNDAAQPSRTVPPGTLPTTAVPTTTVPVAVRCTPADAPLTIEGGQAHRRGPRRATHRPSSSPTDITVGDGPVPPPATRSQMQYVGVLYSDGTEFDASWNRDARAVRVHPRPGAQVIPGWNQGIAGHERSAAAASWSSRPTSPTRDQATTARSRRARRWSSSSTSCRSASRCRRPPTPPAGRPDRHERVPTEPTTTVARARPPRRSPADEHHDDDRRRRRPPRAAGRRRSPARSDGAPRGRFATCLRLD